MPSPLHSKGRQARKEQTSVKLMGKGRDNIFQYNHIIHY